MAICLLGVLDRGLLGVGGFAVMITFTYTFPSGLG
jgi:hypothetical protein